MADFALNDTTTATYDDVQYTAIITDQVKDALMAVVVTPALMDYYTIAGEASTAVKIAKADSFTAAAVSEGVELANTALTSASVTLTAAEIGIMATITDVLELSDIPAAHGARLKQLGRSLGDKIDVDICVLVGAFSTDVGTTNNPLTLAQLLDAIFNLEVADATGIGSLVAVFHPQQTADMRTEFEADAASPYVGKGTGPLNMASNGYFGPWFGIDIFTSTNVPTSNGGNDRGGGVFVRNYALGLVEKWSAKVETMRWIPIRGWVLVATAMYGVGEIEDTAGITLDTDA